MAASPLEEIRDILRTLLDQNQSETVRNEMRDKLLKLVEEPDSGLGRAWKQMSDNTLREHFASDAHQFQEMLKTALPTPQPKEPKPQNYNAVMHRLEIQFAALSLRLPAPTPQNKEEKVSTMVQMVRKEMIELMRNNPRIAALFLREKDSQQKNVPLVNSLRNEFEDKAEMSAMLIGSKGNAKGATLLGGTGQDLGAPITDLQGASVHKRHFEYDAVEKIHEKVSLQGVLKKVLHTVEEAIGKLESTVKHTAPTPFSTVPKK